MNKMLIYLKKKLLFNNVKINGNQSLKISLSTILTLLFLYTSFISDNFMVIYPLVAIRFFLELTISLKSIKHSKLFKDYILGWSSISFLIIIIFFEFKVVSQLKILFIENAILMLILCCSIIFLMLSSEQPKEESIIVDYLYNNTLKPTSQLRNSLLDLSFVLSLFTTSIGLLYCSNLILTSVCYPKYYFRTILLPYDCSFVYVDKQ